jgi:site-specific DNA-methyltransferase (adenine-specific)
MSIYFQNEMIEIYCGDSLNVLATLPNNLVDLVITSPPYNCRKNYSEGDEIPWNEYYHKMELIILECYRILKDGGIIAINIPGVIRWQSEHKFAHTWSDYDPNYNTHRNGIKVTGKGRIEPLGFKLFQIMQKIDNHIREPIIWVKGSENNAICSDYRMGSDNNPYMRPAHELILLGSKKQWHHRGGNGRRGKEAVPFLDYTKDVWFIKPENDPLHPAVFPEEIPLRLIKLFIHASDSIILDPFMGRGTVMNVASKLKYKSIGIDISKTYCQLVANKFSQLELAI